jgi:hypothetical protein
MQAEAGEIVCGTEGRGFKPRRSPQLFRLTAHDGALPADKFRRQLHVAFQGPHHLGLLCPMMVPSLPGSPRWSVSRHTAGIPTGESSFSPG